MSESTSISRVQSDGTWKLTIIDAEGRSAVTVLDAEPTQGDIDALGARLAARAEEAANTPQPEPRPARQTRAERRLARQQQADPVDGAEHALAGAAIADAVEPQSEFGAHEPVDPEVRLKGDVE